MYVMILRVRAVIRAARFVVAVGAVVVALTVAHAAGTEAVVAVVGAGGAMEASQRIKARLI
jgi:hypothetical protein